MEQNNDEIVIDLREIFGILRKNWHKVAGVTALFTAAAVAYVLTATPLYESTVQLQIRRPQNLASDMLNVGEAGQGGQTQQRMGTYKKIFTSRAVVVPLMEEFAERDKNGKLPRVEDFVKKTIKITSERNSEVMQIAVTAKSPEQAQNLNYKLLNGFNVQLQKVTKDLQTNTANVLTKRAEDSKKELKQIRAKMDRIYSSSGNISPVTLSDRVVSRVSSMRQALEDNALAMRQTRIRLAEVEEQLKNVPASEINNETLTKLYEEANMAEAEMRALQDGNRGSSKLEKANKKYEAVQKQIAKMQDKILRDEVPVTSGRYADLKKSKYNLEQELIRRTHDSEYWQRVISEDEVKIPKLLENKREYERICDEERNIKNLNDMILKKLNEIQTAENTDTGHVAVIEEPTYNDKPVSPRKVRIPAVAFVLGIICGSMYVVLKEKL